MGLGVLGLLKPTYVFAPRVALRRVWYAVYPRARRAIEVVTPWGAVLEVSAEETIGRQLLDQGIFDVAVSELTWRLIQPGNLVVDVGANIGYLTSLFAARVGREGRVVAFEPHPDLFRCLGRNVRRNQSNPGMGETQLYSLAVGDQSAAVRLVEPPQFGMNKGVARVTRDPRLASHEGMVAHEVQMMPLDAQFRTARIDLLKIDVEGFEPEVLRGASTLLREKRVCHIVYEAEACEKSPAHGLLAEAGYAIFGIGYRLFGLELSEGASAPRLNRSWQSPSYIATTDPARVRAIAARRGWMILRGRV